MSSLPRAQSLPFDITHAIAQQCPDIKDATNFMLATSSSPRRDVQTMLRLRQYRTQQAFAALALPPSAEEQQKEQARIRPQFTADGVMDAQEATRLFALRPVGTDTLRESYNPLLHWYSAPHLTRASAQTLRFIVGSCVRGALQENMLAHAVAALNARYLYLVHGHLPETATTHLPRGEAQTLCSLIEDISAAPASARPYETLVLRRYQYGFLPTTLGVLKDLRIIDAASSHILAFPAEIALLKRLEHIDLTNCRHLLKPGIDPEVRWHTLSSGQKVPVWRTPWDAENRDNPQAQAATSNRYAPHMRTMTVPVLERIAARAAVMGQAPVLDRTAQALAQQAGHLAAQPKPARSAILLGTVLGSFALTCGVVLATSGLGVATSLGWGIYIGLWQFPQHLFYAEVVAHAEEGADALGRIWGLLSGLGELERTLSGFMHPENQRKCMKNAREQVRHESSVVAYGIFFGAAALAGVGVGTTCYVTVFAPLYGLMALGVACMTAFYMLPALAALAFAHYRGFLFRDRFDNARAQGEVDIKQTAYNQITGLYHTVGHA